MACLKLSFSERVGLLNCDRTLRKSVTILLGVTGVFVTVLSSSGQVWIQTTAPAIQWRGLASSFDGTRMVAGAEYGNLYISHDSGTNWTVTSAPSHYWQSVACSADGMRLVALADKIYRSADSGITWITNNSPTAALWGCVASSDDGAKLVAGAIYDSSNKPGRIYTSTNFGVNWVATSAPSNNWYAVASSADGSQLLAAGDYHLHLSTNSGTDWIVTSAPYGAWTSVASSGDGRVLAATVNSSYVYISTNLGVSWKFSVALSSLNGVAIDKAGNVLMAFGFEQIFVSSDSGETWKQIESPAGSLRQAAASGDGSKWIAGHSSGGIYLLKIDAPIIINQPSNQVVAAGLNAVFTPSVIGAEPRSYHWTFDGVELPGATNSTLLLTNVNLSAAGQYSLLASNRYGVTWSSNAELSVVGAKVTTRLAGAISATGASLVADVTVGLSPSMIWFDWGVDTSYGNQTQSYFLTAPSQTWWIGVNGLDGELVYHYRAAVSNSLGITYGEDKTFQTGLVPSASTLNPTGITTNSAELCSVINPQGRQTVAYFRWGTISGETNISPGIPVGQGAVGINLTNLITDLAPGAIFKYSVVASNSLGVSTGKTVYFTTGPWFPVNAPNQSWNAVACSADGRLWAATAITTIYTSTNRGASWVSNNVPAAQWSSIASAADGRKLAAASDGTSQGGIPLGRIYTSEDSGVTWSMSGAPAGNWSSIACSADGNKLVAADDGTSSGRQIHTSTNFGSTWTTNALPPGAWRSVACSADGMTLIAASGGNGQVYLSTNSGAIWNLANLPITNWSAVASSADGGTLIAAGGGTQTRTPIFTSTNFGATWKTSNLPAKSWTAVACSADGRTLLGVAFGAFTEGGLFVSTNGGAIWTTNLPLNLWWKTGASSADGSLLLAAADAAQQIYALQTTPHPELRLIRQDGGAMASWLVPSLDFTLEESVNLASSQWTNVITPPEMDLNTLRYQVTVPITNGTFYYRLRQR